MIHVHYMCPDLLRLTVRAVLVYAELRATFQRKTQVELAKLFVVRSLGDDSLRFLHGCHEKNLQTMHDVSIC